MNYHESNVEFIKSELYSEIINISPRRNNTWYPIENPERRMLYKLITNFVYSLTNIYIKHCTMIFYLSDSTFNIRIYPVDNISITLFNNTDLIYLKKVKDRKKKLEKIFSQ
jgi:hypothetical protein